MAIENRSRTQRFCRGGRGDSATLSSALSASSAALWYFYLSLFVGCSHHGPARSTTTRPEPGGERSLIVYDTTAARRVPPRDDLERQAQNRGPDLDLIDRLTDPHTEPPKLDRRPLPPVPPDARIGDGVGMLDDARPFADPIPLPNKEVTVRFGAARSTYRTREPEEVLASLQPLLDVIQRDVNVRTSAELFETPEVVYYALLDGKVQMVIAHAFDYLLIRSWFANQPDNGLVPLAWVKPSNPRSTGLDRDLPGPMGTSIELVVAHDSRYKSIADLKGARLALTANYVDGPAAFLTRLLADIPHPHQQPYFGEVRLRRYAKDALIDVLKGKADAACVDQGTVGGLIRFYGIEPQIRTLAVSPRYNVDVLFTSLNNLAKYQTEIELTQTQLPTLGKDPEGQEVLFFFETAEWVNYRDGDLDVPVRHFGDFTTFLDQTPADLKPLLDPHAAVDRRTYDRFGDE